MKYTKILVVIVSMLFPAGIALAESGSGLPHVGVSGDLQVKAQLQGTPSIQGVGDADKDGHPESGKGSDENQVQKEDKNSGTNPMFEGNRDNQKGAHSTSTPSVRGGDDSRVGTSSKRIDDNGKGFGKGGVAGFLRWIFGMPDSTTIGDIRAQMTATSTASTSTSVGLGFWARLFGAFHFGRSN